MKKCSKNRLYMKRIRVVVGSDNSKKVSREHCKLLWVWVVPVLGINLRPGNLSP